MEGTEMSIATESILVERSKKLSGVLHAACMVAEFLTERGTAEVLWRIPGKRKCGERKVGSGSEDEDFGETLEEIESLIRTWSVCLRTADLEITIS